MTGHTVTRSYSSFWRILRLLSIVAMLAMVMGANLQSAAAQTAVVPTVTSDKADYAPGELVTLTGANWAAGEGVHLYVVGDGNPLWDLSADVVSDVNGGFVFSFNLPTWFIANYTVTATGTTSGTVTTTFTDMSIGTYDQCSNDQGSGYTGSDTGCHWINSNLQQNNSKYSEGDSTVQRIWLTGFIAGSTHTVSFDYGTTKNGKHAYDYLTTWNASENWITDADRCQDITGCTNASDSGYSIPDDPNVTNTIEPAVGTGRQFIIRGGTITNISTPAIVSGAYTGDSDTRITITFTVDSNNSGPMCSSGTCDIAMWFGAHVARTDLWTAFNNTTGAGNISGSPYHVSLAKIDGASAGSRDNQMASSAIVPNGTIVIKKDAIPNDAQLFNFTLVGGTVNTPFTLQDNGTTANTQSFSVTPGTYTASEVNIPAGWSFTNLTCVDATNNTTVSGAVATINVASAETVTCTYTNTKGQPAVSIVKKTNGTDNDTAPGLYIPAGSTVNWTYIVTNTGNVPLTSVTVTDDKNVAVTCPKTTLAVAESMTCTGSGTAIAGQYTNTGTVNAVSAAGNATASNLDNYFGTAPALSLTKNASPTTYNTAGQTITYTYVLKNTGNVALTAPYAVTDDKATVTCPQTPSPLAVGGTITCSATYIITQADVDSGSVTNVATATAKYGTTTVTSNQAQATVNAQKSSVLSLTKTDDLNPAKYDHVGQVVTFTLSAKNTGNTTLHNVSVRDNPALDTYSCQPSIPAASLAPNASIVCTGKHTISQADLDNGSFHDVASATSTEANAPDAPDTIYANQNPHLSLTKSVAETSFNAAGVTLHYTLVATNDGNVPLTAVSIVDTKLGTLSCTPAQPASLAPGAKLTCTGTYVTTLADLEFGRVDNTANASGKFGQTNVPAAPASASVPAVQNPHLSLTKSVAETSFNAVGVTLHYTLVATNDGNVTLTAVSIMDAKLGTLDCTPAQPATLAPGAKLTCTGSYVTTLADLEAGKVDNTANAGGMFGQTQVPALPASASVPALQSPHISLTKVATEPNYSKVGDVIHYTLVAKNDGNVTLTNVSISDPKLGTLVCTQPVTLAPGASLSCTGTHTVTQADLDAGKYDNTATTSGNPPTGQPVTATASASVPALQSAHISLTKVATEPSYSKVGDVIHYTLVATNDGSVTLTNVSIVDAQLGTLVCTPTQPATLAPTATISCTGSHTVTQADLDAGKYDNTATAAGTPPTGPVVNATASASVPGAQSAHISLTKVATETSYNKVGDVIHYTLVATNDGNVTLTNVSISDPKLGTLTCTQPVTLVPGATLSCTGSHTVTQADLDAGKYDNTATTTGNPPTGQPVTATATATVPAGQTPHLSLTKSVAETSFNAAGVTLHYTLVATNDGNVTLTAVSIVDAMLGTLSCTPAQPATLAPGAKLTCTGSYVTTLADLNAGRVDNTATASGKFGETNVPSEPASASVPGAQGPAISLTKVAAEPNYAKVGDVLHYTLVATNIGNVTLNSVVITDAKLGALTCNPGQPATLVPGAKLTCSGSYTVVAGDITAAKVDNTATVASKLPSGSNGPSVSASATVPYVPVVGDLKVTKVVNWVGQAGDPSLQFTICAQGPSLLTESCVALKDGESHTWSNLTPGTYKVTEKASYQYFAEYWDVSYSNPSPIVVAGQTMSVTVTNTNKVPTAVQLMYFKVKSVNGLSVNLEWATGSEISNWGYLVLMSNTPDMASAHQVFELPVDTGLGRQPGATYNATITLSSKQPAYFWLVDVDLDGTPTYHGPIAVTDNKVFIPQVTR